MAPHHLRRAFTRLVEREAEHAPAGRPAGIIVKNNSVADPEMVRVLYRAAQAGVPIDMILADMLAFTVAADDITLVIVKRG